MFHLLTNLYIEKCPKKGGEEKLAIQDWKADMHFGSNKIEFERIQA